MKRTYHGMSNTKLYRIWCDMRKRCRDKNVQHYDRYGGRGIKVCDEWNIEFMPFYEWAMANGYKEGLSIDRIDNNGSYEPSNCRWVSSREQKWNTSQNVFIEHDGERKCLAQWCEELGVSYSAASARIERGETDFNRIMSIEPLKESIEKRRKNKRITRVSICGVSKPITQWAEELNLNKKLVQGWRDAHGANYVRDRLATIIKFKQDGKPWNFRSGRYYYILEKDGVQHEFGSEQDACRFVGVHQASVYRCFKEGRTCNGYAIQRLESFPTVE